MALDEINEYPNTATAIVTGSFFDIDMLIGTGTWQSQKVRYRNLAESKSTLLSYANFYRR
jgi:hypothetical protein